MVFVSFESESVNCLVMSNSVRPSAVAHQAPLSMEFFRQEYWSGLPFPSPGNPPNSGIKPRSLTDSLISEPLSSAQFSSVQFSHSVMSDSFEPLGKPKY